jgi:hypothetical protein
MLGVALETVLVSARLAAGGTVTGSSKAPEVTELLFESPL